METYRIRPEHGGTRLLVEFCGDHRGPRFPDVAQLLAAALGAAPEPHPVFAAHTMIATDRYVGRWRYAGGTYEIDDDVHACFITVADGGARVVADIERALADSGRFVRADPPTPAAPCTLRRP